MSKPSNSCQVTMTTHRVTEKTKAPYLARVKDNGGTEKEPLLIWVYLVFRERKNLPPIGRALVVSGYAKSKYFHTGAEVTVTNFKGMERIVFTGVPKSL